ncbi:MAG: type II toxin-antitoxin system ParD family antitoxin [Acetobacteraceae bacterium]|jgi:antitoxin ParD1/3/4
MSRNTSLTLGDHFADFVDQQVGSGRYGSASEVVRAGLRLLEQQEAQLAALRAALIEGETSGRARPLDVEAFLKGGGRSARAG